MSLVNIRAKLFWGALRRHRTLTHACEIITQGGEIHNTMARRVSVRMSNTGQDSKIQDFLRACRIAIAANASCPPTNAEGAVARQ